jgi:hypothetical protein
MNLIRVFGLLSARICLGSDREECFEGRSWLGEQPRPEEEVKEELKILIAVIALAVFGALFIIGGSIERQSEKAAFCLTHDHGEQIPGTQENCAEHSPLGGGE